MQHIRIENYTDLHKEKVRKLIIEIQQEEFQIDINLEQQPDLNNIPNFYQKQKGGFWIALAQEEVVGTIGLLDIGNNQAALRKMFVHKDFRGKEYKVGQQLLDTLIAYAKAEKVTTIYLGTTEKFVAAQRFYEKNGFVEINTTNLPDTFPKMSVDVTFYKLLL